MFSSFDMLKSSFGDDRIPAARKRRGRAQHPCVDGLELRALLSPITVPGNANIYGAGIAAPPAPAKGGAGVLPIEVKLSGSPEILEFPTVTGTVTAGGGHFNGPDGGTYFGGVTNLQAVGDISGIHDSHATMFLVGVFLGPNGQPATAPAVPNVTNANSVTSFSPLLGQQFFIGNGLTSTGAIQTFNVPKGATRLYLGFADGFDFGNPDTRPGAYGDDGGSLKVTIKQTITAQQGQAVAQQAIALVANYKARGVTYPVVDNNKNGSAAEHGGLTSDCTWFVNDVLIHTFTVAPYSSTAEFPTSMGYVSVPADQAQAGDVMVQGGHAGIFMGIFDKLGHPLGAEMGGGGPVVYAPWGPGGWFAAPTTLTYYRLLQ